MQTPDATSLHGWALERPAPQDGHPGDGWHSCSSSFVIGVKVVPQKQIDPNVRPRRVRAGGEGARRGLRGQGRRAGAHPEQAARRPTTLGSAAVADVVRPARADRGRGQRREPLRGGRGHDLSGRHSALVTSSCRATRRTSGARRRVAWPPSRRPAGASRAVASSSWATPASTRRPKDQEQRGDGQVRASSRFPLTLLILVFAFGALVAGGDPAAAGAHRRGRDHGPARPGQPAGAGRRIRHARGPAHRHGRRRGLQPVLPQAREGGARGRTQDRRRDRGCRRDLRPRCAHLRLHRDDRDGRHVSGRNLRISPRSRPARSWSSQSR